MDHSFQVPDFFQGMWDESLSAKTRVYAHKAYMVNIFNNISQGFNRGMGIDGYAGFHAQGFNLLDIAMQIPAGFDMYDQLIGPGLAKCFR